MNLNDWLVIIGAGGVVAGCYLMSFPMGLIATGGIIFVIGLARMRGTHGPD